MKQTKINRRSFLNNSLTVGAFSLIGGKTITQNIKTYSSTNSNVYREPEKELQVYGNYDVIVVGGGPAGFAAALSSVRNGAKTIIIERFPFFGGTATASLMTNINGYRNQVMPDGLQTSKGIAEEVILRLKEINGLGKSSYAQEEYATEKGRLSYSYAIDSEKTKYLLTKMLYDEGIKILFHTIFVDTIMEGENVEGIIIENISGRQALFGKVIIDASGDADVAYKAGAPYWQADVQKDKHLANCLMYRVGGVDPVNIDKINGPKTKNSVLYWGPGSDLDVTNADNLTRSEIETRLAVFEHFKKQQERSSPALDNASIIETAPLLGIRQFDDSISMSACPIISYYGYRRYLEHEGYEIPYRCLLPQKVEGLLVAGRCISSDQQSYESWRAMAPTMCLGEAAGTAAALCVKSRKSPKEIDVEMLRDQLVKQGAEIGQNKKN
jgi:hypothetical protein